MAAPEGDGDGDGEGGGAGGAEAGAGAAEERGRLRRRRSDGEERAKRRQRKPPKVLAHSIWPAWLFWGKRGGSCAFLLGLFSTGALGLFCFAFVSLNFVFKYSMH